MFWIIVYIVDFEKERCEFVVYWKEVGKFCIFKGFDFLVFTVFGKVSLWRMYNWIDKS